MIYCFDFDFVFSVCFVINNNNVVAAIMVLFVDIVDGDNVSD